MYSSFIPFKRLYKPCTPLQICLDERKNTFLISLFDDKYTECLKELYAAHCDDYTQFYKTI
jgi:hypothetical protein